MADNFSLESLGSQYGFSFIHYSGKAYNSNLHIDKNLFSIFMLLTGDITYDVEGKIIRIKPDDILLIGNNELHRFIAKQNSNCEYLLLMVNLDFLIKNDCTAFSEMVFNRTPGENNVISADVSIANGINEIIKRLDRYCGEKPPELCVVNGVIIELLYNLNKQVEKSGKTGSNKPKVNDIIDYINDNLTDDLSLDRIAKRFFLTKQYLCKIFKKNTGYTVNKYITYRRIVLVKEAYSNGMTLSEACYKAGFNDYSSFYRAYSRIANKSPRKDLGGK
ncbi:MAG: helix-turn-helix transcriptional regulator [Clostridia bacterium]|nr:helix-turn-helix transcriptional regulator [Clostridia bacterium]